MCPPATVYNWCNKGTDDDISVHLYRVVSVSQMKDKTGGKYLKTYTNLLKDPHKQCAWIHCEFTPLCLCANISFTVLISPWLSGDSKMEDNY